MARVRVQLGKKTLELSCDEETRLLEALAEADLYTRNPCRNGVCGLCKCQLVSGEITYLWRQPHGLWEKDKAQNFILPCIAYPVTDLKLENLALIPED
jgi:ferredoxin